MKSFITTMLLACLLLTINSCRRSDPNPGGSNTGGSGNGNGGGTGTPTPPTLSTKPISGITTATAASGGTITNEGSSAVTARGVCWSTTTAPTTANSKTTDGTGTGDFISTVTGLSPSTTYFLRAYATNTAGTSYGDEFSFTTLNNTIPTTVPVVTTSPTTYIATNNSIQSGGNVTSAGSTAVTARGVVWNTSPNPTTANNKTNDGTGIGVFTSTISGLNANTTYYIRAYATNTSGTSYGNQATITTPTGGGTSPFTIGQTFGGGIIFYIDATGQHGLIAATEDQGSAVWDYRGNPTFINATSDTDGKSNTDKIITALGNTQSYAARICRNFNSGGFNDWFLPSGDQLDLLYQQRNTVGGFNLTSGEYWSSTEADADKAWMQEFRNGSNSGRQDDDNKGNNLRVRPVRAF